MGHLLFSLITSRNGALLMVLAVSIAGVLTRNCSSSQSGQSQTSENANKGVVINNSIFKEIELKLTSDKTEIGTGQCANLQLDAFNPGSGPVRWDSHWVFEQEGSTPLEEAFPRSDLQLPPGRTTATVKIRLCHSDLQPGFHRYRISAAPTSVNPSRSNQVTIRVLP